MEKFFNVILAVVFSFAFGIAPSWGGLATPPAWTPTAPSHSRPPSQPVYLTGDEKVWGDFPKKPVLGSDADQLDLKLILSIQASRTKDQKNEALRDQHYLITLMTDVIDPSFQTKYPHIYAVLGQADKDAYFITAKLKGDNARLRPYLQHPTEVQPLFKPDGYSYPSGHASGMQLQARILATLFHTNGQDALLLKRAREVGDSRVVAGVHYTSDVKAGIDLGDLLFTELEATPAFKDALTAAARADNIAMP
jgi:acid phosphatase (class A)